MSDQAKIYFFGVFEAGKPGHYLYRPEGRQVHGAEEKEIPFKTTICDGGLLTQPEDQGRLAFRGRRVVGSVQYICEPVICGEGLASICLLYVKPDARLCGIGRGLIERCAELAKRDGARRLVCTCRADSPAVDFYERMGFYADDPSRSECGRNLYIYRPIKLPSC